MAAYGTNDLWCVMNDRLDEYQADRTPTRRALWLKVFAEYQEGRRRATRRHLAVTYGDGAKYLHPGDL